MPLAVVLAAVGVAAVGVQRNGVVWGDDFTLYLRQARALVDGNVGQVIADNRDDVLLAAKPGFSPLVYPWGWPIILAPFVRLFGFDYARLKLVEVGCWLLFLGCFDAVLRRRMPRLLALATVAVVGTSLPYLKHTDMLLSELPYMALVGATLCWLDRCRRAGWLDLAPRRDLVVLGLLAMLVFDTRREGLAIVPALAAVQLLDGRRRWSAVSRRAALTPLAAFLGGVVGLQLVLPSALAPHYAGAGLHQTWRKLGGPFRTAFRAQLDLGSHSRLAWLVFGAALVGVVVRLLTAAADDIALVVFPLVSTVIVGMIPADGERYLLPITPFAIYFAVQALARLPAGPLRHRPPVARSAAATVIPPAPSPVVAGVTSHVVASVAVAAALAVHLLGLPDDIRDAQRFNDRGVVQDGPLSAPAVAAFGAVERFTQRDDIVAFFKARAMTLYTDRRAVQSSDLGIILQRADFFLMRRSATAGGQPQLNGPQAAAAGLTEVWSNAEWVLWRVPAFVG